MLRSIGAVLAGIIAIFVLSLGVDQIFHMLNVYPPWGQPMWDPKLNLFALSYRLVIDTFGGWLTARLAPRNPMRHALILGAIGFVLSGLGAIGAIVMEKKMGPSWYPILLWISALPTAWLGGWITERRAHASSKA